MCECVYVDCVECFVMFSATVIVRYGDLFSLKTVAMVLFMFCRVVLVEWFLLKACCVEICGILFVMYGSSVLLCCCCLPSPMTLASGGSPMFPLVVHHPASLSICSAV